MAEALKLEVGSRKLEVGRLKPGVGRQESEAPLINRLWQKNAIGEGAELFNPAPTPNIKTLIPIIQNLLPNI